MSWQQATVIVLTTFATLIFVSLYFVLRHSHAAVRAPPLAVPLALLLMLPTPLYAPWLTKHFYLGQASPSLWHNTSLIVVKPLALAAFALCATELSRSSRPASDRTLLGATLLAVSTWIKPSFVFVALPACALYLVLFSPRDWHRMIWFALLAAPTIGFLGLQYLAYYGSRSEAIVFDPLGVWGLYAKNIPISILLSVAFPLAVLLFRGRDAGPALRLAWLAFAVGAAQFALLAEVLDYDHANFSWGMQSVIQILFLYSVVECLRLSGRRRWRSALFCWSLFGLHVVSGLIYAHRLYAGETYF